MAHNLYDVGDRSPHGASSWLNDKDERRGGLLPVGLMLAGSAIAVVVTILIAGVMPPASGVAKPGSVLTITDQFGLCDDIKGDACVLSADAYAWRGHRYHLSDIRVPVEDDARCAAEADRARKGRATLAAMMNGGAFEARPDAADADPSARILVRDGVSIGSLMILKGHARAWSHDPIDWCGNRKLAPS